jgi:hypothetical protein
MHAVTSTLPGIYMPTQEWEYLCSAVDLVRINPEAVSQSRPEMPRSAAAIHLQAPFSNTLMCDPIHSRLMITSLVYCA